MSCASRAATAASLTGMRPDPSLGEQAEVRGVKAGVFDPQLWERGDLHLVFNDPAPIIEPQDGRFRNIYAPSILQEHGGWRVFYGAWDGVDTPNDRIYSRWTTDFLTFTDRRLLIDHGAFQHVCNCSALRLPDGEYRLMATAYPTANGKNKPAAFTSPDAIAWNGSAPNEAAMSDLIDIRGYAGFADADINGVNAILYEDGVYRLYFNDFHNFGTVYRATSRDFRTFDLDEAALAAPRMVNDVKRIDIGKERWYLMALHANTDHLWYSLSRDGLHFDPPKDLTPNRGAEDRYIVAVGWALDGRSVLGFLYGAGAVPALNQNRIFAKWLQKRVVFVADDGRVIEAASAHGPDRVRLTVPAGGVRGRLDVYGEDGRTLLCRGPEIELRAGDVWAFRR